MQQDGTRTITVMNDFSIKCPAEWRWPAWGFYTKANDWQEVYANRAEKSRSTMVVYGMRNIGNELYSSHVRFQRGNVKIIEIGDISDILNPHTDYLMATPVLWCQGHDCKMVVHTNADAIHHCDHVRPLGFVVEPLGFSETG
jgi:hypothetical protein